MKANNGNVQRSDQHQSNAALIFDNSGAVNDECQCRENKLNEGSETRPAVGRSRAGEITQHEDARI